MDTHTYQTEGYRRNGGVSTFLDVFGIFVLCVCLFVGIFHLNGLQSTEVEFPQKYYFLARECEETTSSAVAGQVYFSGGAGYLLEANGQSAVALACYFTQEEAESVQRTLSEKGTETLILEMAPKTVTLHGEKTEEKERILSNAKTLDTCAKILYDAANGLERTTLSQEEARAAVRGVVKVLSGLRTENGSECYSRWNVCLKEAERRGIEIAEGILFAKDLRYLQVQLCYSAATIGGYLS